MSKTTKNMDMDKAAMIQAWKDIKEELHKEHKHMMMFRQELNPVMRYLVKRHYFLAENQK